MDLRKLNQMYETYNSRSTTVAQAYVEQWGLDTLTEVEAEANQARDEWARAVFEAWPEIRTSLAAKSKEKS